MKSKIILRIAGFSIFMLIIGNICFAENNKSSGSETVIRTNLIADSNETFLQTIPVNFVGYWVNECGLPSGTLSMENDKNNKTYVKIGLFSSLPQYDNWVNRIYITANLKMSSQSPNTLEVYFKKADEVGESVSPLSWENFATDVPIVTLEFLNNHSLKFNWLGFFNKKTTQREWKEGPVWISKDFSGILKKCIEINPPKDNPDDFNQYTFKTKSEDLLFYYNTSTNIGKIVIDGKEYKLNRDNTSKLKDGKFGFSGDNVKIETSAIFWFKNEGEDCRGGSFENVTITLIPDGSSTTIIDAEMEICEGG